jgi:predicted dehydrogenase
MGERLPVGIVGARGIGKHHAKWFHHCGCEVVAVYGRTPESCAQAEAGLRGVYDFRGEMTWDWPGFVADRRFAAVSVCSPAEAHASQVIDLVRTGKDVLCEKPLVWDWQSSGEAILGPAERMVAAARETGRLLGVNAQYPAAVQHYRELYRRARGEEPRFETLSFVMETKGKARNPHPGEVWVDLAPHALALLDAMLPGGRIDPSDEQVVAEPGRVRCEFTWVTPEKRPRVSFALARVPGDPFARRFGADGLMAEYEGRNQAGEFVAVLRLGEQEWIGEDFMRASIRHFVAAVQSRDPQRLLVTGEAALRHLREQVRIWDRYW